MIIKLSETLTKASAILEFLLANDAHISSGRDGRQNPNRGKSEFSFKKNRS